MDNYQKQPILNKISHKIDTDNLPKHQPQKFIDAAEQNLIDIQIEDDVEVGFTIRGFTQFYEMDYEEGFFEPNGCYYTKDYKPKGWWVLDVNEQEYFYDLNGYLDGEFEGGEESDEEIGITQK